MKNHFKLFLIAVSMSTAMFACKGSLNEGSAGTSPQTDSVKTGKDMNTDSVSNDTKNSTGTSKVRDSSSKM
jgi:hypothetical protein